MSTGAVFTSLRALGCERAEVYRKQGRTRRIDRTLGGCAATLAEEAGWSARAGDDTSHLFFAASGEPRSDIAWPEPATGGLRLPKGIPAQPWQWPKDLETPLIGEQEALALIAGMESTLGEEMKAARLLDVSLEDGASEAWIESTTGLEAYGRFRLATLRVSAMRHSDDPVSVSLASAARGARDFVPGALARRLVDLLTVHGKREAGGVPSSRGALLAPEVAARLIGALRPALVGAEAWRHLRFLQEDDGRLASPAVTLVDDGRLAGGLLSSPVDGEGVATREVVLVDEGVVRQPLLPWWQESAGAVISGCSQRFSWREAPRLSATHLYLAPDPQTPAAALLDRLGEGAYLIDAGEPHVDLERDRFELPVAGFVVDQGRPVATLAEVRLGGSVAALLHGIVAVARDLRFLASEGMIGAPSVLVQPVEWV